MLMITVHIALSRSTSNKLTFNSFPEEVAIPSCCRYIVLGSPDVEELILRAADDELPVVATHWSINISLLNATIRETLTSQWLKCD